MAMALHQTNWLPCLAPAPCLLFRALCRDTPLPHVAARHKQAEKAAREEVKKVLIKRGRALYKFVEDGPG